MTTTNPTHPPKPATYSTAEACLRLGLSREALMRRIYTRQLSAHKDARGYWRVVAADVDALAAAQSPTPGDAA